MNAKTGSIATSRTTDARHMRHVMSPRRGQGGMWLEVLTRGMGWGAIEHCRRCSGQQPAL